MRMQNLSKNKKRIKKSHVLICGSLLVFMGLLLLSRNYLLKMKDAVYSDMKIAMMDVIDEAKSDKQVVETPVANNIEGIGNEYHEIDYSKYLGVLEIPKIGLKRGFYNVGSRYNNIEYNVTMVEGSTLPDVVNGNLILLAHSGDAYISYFAYLWRLNIGDFAYVTYRGQKFTYQIVNIYEVPKNGIVNIRRNYSKTTLTMITCTKNNDYTQSVYIAEFVG